MFIALVLWILWFFHCFAFTVLFSFLESCKLMSTSHDKYRGGTGPCLTWVSISVFFSLGYVRRRYLANYWSSVINKYQRRSCSYRVTANYFFPSFSPPFPPPPPPPPPPTTKKKLLKKKNQTLANWQINGVSFLKMFRFRDRLCDDPFFCIRCATISGLCAIVTNKLAHLRVFSYGFK